MSAATRLATDVAGLRERARAAGERLATLTLETEIRFASPTELRRFADELAAETSRLAAKYDRPDLRRARPYRLLAAAHPAVTKEEP